MSSGNSLANTVMMMRATYLAANAETCASNAFQASSTEPGAALRAMREQDAMIRVLEAEGVRVLVFEPRCPSPDGVFPNNWFSTHEDGRLVLYPMEAPSRRAEVMHDLAGQFVRLGYHVSETVDLTGYVREGRYLEGTGSLVLDRGNRVAYALPSSRTDPGLVREWCERSGFEPFLFDAADPSGKPVYHTNVVMALGAGLAIVCLESVRDAPGRRRLVKSLENGSHEIVDIDWEQLRSFAGNQLFLQGSDGPVVALSAQADAALRPEQKRRIDAHARRVVANIATIERHGGGSVRCMLAEIFLPKKKGSDSE